MYTNRGYLGSRAQWRGRGAMQGGRGDRRWDPTPPLPPPSPSQVLLESITSKHKVPQSDSKSFSITDCEYVASYNWLEKKAVIVVPGSPATWQPPVDIPALQEDNPSLQYFRDPNAARFPHCPSEPAVRAIIDLNPQFNGSSVDIVGCGSTLGSLLSVAKGEDRTFRFGVERIGSTLFLVRRGNSPQDSIQGIRGYGHTFPEAYTVWEPAVKNSPSHQRLIRYDFGGLHILVRSESDGYLPGKIPSLPMNTASSPRPEGLSPEDLDIGALSFPNPSAQPSITNKNLKIVKGGTCIPQAALFDLKTRSANNDFNMADMLPRLWVNQTPNFILAFHKKGRFEDIRITDMREDVKDWESKNQVILRKFHALIARLIEAVDSKRRVVEVRRTASGDLELWSENKAWEALPSGLKKRWMGEPEEVPVGRSKKSNRTRREGASDSDELHDASDDESYLDF